MKKNIETIFNGKNGDFKILKRDGNNFEIIFLETGYKTIANIKYIKHGSILRNKGIPSILGIGIVGKDLKTTLEKKLYETWRQMIKRCFGENYAKSHKTLKISICDSWKSFINFEEDIKKLDGWSEELFLKKQIVLDKDKKRREQNLVATEYNIKNCSWITKKENSLYTIKSKKIEAIRGNEKIIANSIKEMSRKLKINEKTVSKYLNSTYLGWEIKQIEIKR